MRNRPARDSLVAFLTAHPEIREVLKETGAEGDTDGHRLTRHIAALVNDSQPGACPNCSGDGSACGGAVQEVQSEP